MSRSLYLICNDCKKSTWIGQTDFVYNDNETIDKLRAFLANHVDHPLVFTGDELKMDDVKCIDKEFKK
jgi:hypothetical protein